MLLEDCTNDAGVVVRKWKLLIVSVVVVLAVVFGAVPVLRRSVPGRVVRWCLGEPGATQGVNDAADKIIARGWDRELIGLADQLMKEYASTASALSIEPFTGGRLLPPERLPENFRTLGGGFSDPDFVLRLDSFSRPTEVVISWGHMRHGIIVYAVPPAVPPEGFFVRRVNDRIYVIANES
jgi:hypothetical protein